MKKMFLKALLFIAWLCPMAVDAAVTIDPYLQSPTKDAMTISWDYNSNVKSTVEYGKTKALGSKAKAAHLPEKMVKDKLTKYWHIVRLTGLTPDTVYYYRCKTGKDKSAIFKFRTLPKDNIKKGHIRFILYGDSRSNPKCHKAVVEAAMQKVADEFAGGNTSNLQNEIAFTMDVGDIVNWGTNLGGYNEQFFEPIKELSKNVPYLVAIGNHEVDNKYFWQHMNYEPYDCGEKTERYYKFRAGPILFLSLNSNLKGDTQRDWTEQQLQTAEADANIDWVIIFIHHPGHSEIWPAGNTPWVQDTLIPLLENYNKVCGLYYGHSHCYEMGANPDKPFRIMLTGSGGAEMDRWGEYSNQTDYPEIYKSFDHYGYTIFDFNIAAKRYTAKTYSLGHIEDELKNKNGDTIGKTLDNVLIDTFRQTRREIKPAKPRTSYPAKGIPVKLIASPYVCKGRGKINKIMTSHFQVKKAGASNSSKPLVDCRRNWINYYGDTGFPDYEMVDKNDGINLSELAIKDGIKAGDRLIWRVRYRSQNLVWSDWSNKTAFIVKCDRATIPFPRDDTFADGGVALNWSAGTKAVSHTVYLGTSATLSTRNRKGNQTGTSYTPTGLKPNTTYFWRIDEKKADGTTTKGDVWKFKVLPELITELLMDGNVKDNAEPKFNGTAVGKPAYTAGRIGKAIELNTNLKYVALRNPDELQFGSSVDFTVAFWIKTSGWKGDPAIISNKSWKSGTNPGWAFAGNENGTNWKWNYFGSTRIDWTPTGASTIINDNKWHHLAVSCDRDGNATFFQDGVLVGTADISKSTGSVDSGLSIVIGQDGTKKYKTSIQGTFDEVKIWRKALTKAEVKAVYDAAK